MPPSSTTTTTVLTPTANTLSSSLPHADATTTTTSTMSIITQLRTALNSPDLPLSHRYRALFALKHHACQAPPTQNTLPAIEAMASALATPSALLKHEIAYCLGQTRNTASAPYLRVTLEDGREEAMVRHEAAEALGALGEEDSVPLLVRMRDDPRQAEVVRETCEIAVERIRWERDTVGRRAERVKKSAFASIDPAPPMAEAESEGGGAHATVDAISSLQKTLMNSELPLFLRYRAMFALRDLASPPSLPTALSAVQALSTGFADSSALFRHEIAFVFGQLSHPASIASLFDVLGKKGEAAMVRHEAAEALGSMGDEDGVEERLRGFVEDEEEVVRESVIVALDMAEFEKSGEIQWAGLPPGERVAEISV